MTVGLSHPHGFSFSPNGRHVLIGSGDGFVRVLDAESGKRVGDILVQPGVSISVRSSPDSRLLVTAADNTARVWDAETGKPVGEPITRAGTVKFASFSPDGARVLTLSEDGTARVWRQRWAALSDASQLVSTACRSTSAEALRITSGDRMLAPIISVDQIGNSVCERAQRPAEQ